LVWLSDDQSFLARVRDAAGEIPAIVGTATELAEQIEGYRAAGVDEFIVPDFTLGRGAERRDMLDRFLTEVAKPFREADE
jgi:alkanesulfonate monooxygenase SsuD/methylene tetrahydromethanopterin reductase-like flavin-dependent oxidoreductase (luciferase family)